MKHRVGVIVVAAGRGTRLSSRVDKPHVLLAGKPMVRHSLETFESCACVDDVVLVVHPRHIRDCRKVYAGRTSLSKIRVVVRGGNNRQESVRRGLEALGPEVGVVLVHDAARPFVCARIVRDVVRWAKTGVGVVPGMPATQTIKRVDSAGRVVETLPRETLREIQTPQGFPREMIDRAYARARKTGLIATDDAGLVERAGGTVKVIAGLYQNLKITTPQDLILARMMARENQCRR